MARISTHTPLEITKEVWSFSIQKTTFKYPIKLNDMRNQISLALLLILIGGTDYLYGQKIGFINASNLLSELPVTKQAEANLIAQQTELQNKLQQMTNAFQQGYQLFQQKEMRGELSPEQRKKMLTELETMENEITRVKQEANKKMETSREEIFSSIQNKLVNVIVSVARENGYDFVFDSNSFLYADPSFDISPMVKLKMENIYVLADNNYILEAEPNVIIPSKSVLSAFLTYGLNTLNPPKVSILPDGSIKVTYDDGSYDIYLATGGIERYFAKTGETTRILGYEMQRAEIPKPLQNFLNTQQQETWLKGLAQWLEVLAEDSFNEIAKMIADDPNGITYYSNLEKTKCSNIYEKLDFRLKFLQKLRQAKSSNQ